MLEIIAIIIGIIFIIYEINEYIKTTKEMRVILKRMEQEESEDATHDSKQETYVDSLDENFEDYFFVSGTNYYKDNIKNILTKKTNAIDGYIYNFKNDNVVLKPEPDNPYDKNAIAVYMNNAMIGHVPAKLTHAIRPLLDTNAEFVGSIYCGDKLKNGEIIEEHFKCEVRVIE